MLGRKFRGGSGPRVQPGRPPITRLLGHSVNITGLFPSASFSTTLMRRCTVGFVLALVLLTSLLPLTRVSTQSSPAILGYNTIGSILDSGDAGSMNGSRFTTGQSAGTATSITAYVGNTGAAPNNQYQMAIYTDNNGDPGTLLSQTATGALTGNSWNTLPISASLNANTAYWLFYNTNGSSNVNNIYYSSAGQNQGAFATYGFGAWPTSFPGKTLGGWEFSIYVTYTPVSSSTPTSTPSPTPTSPPTSYLFDDEFNGQGLDTATWVALNRDSESGGDCFLPSNVSVSGGTLQLVDKRDATGCAQYGESYSSAGIQWRSLQFLYGRVDIRAKMAGDAYGVLWMLGTNCQVTNLITGANTGPCNWPAAGSDEIDIAEFKNSTWTSTWQNVDSPNGTWSTCIPTLSDSSQNYHVYSLDWEPTSLTWYIDGIKTCQFTSATTYIPYEPMWLIINGTETINNSNPTSLPATTYVDYVRITPSLAITSPAPGSALSGPVVPFTWSGIPGLGGTRQYALWVGSTPGGNDLQYLFPTTTSQTATVLPKAAGTVYVRLWVFLNGSWSAYQDFTYTTASHLAISSPTPGSTLSGTSVPFSWTSVAGATRYAFWVGSSPGGVNLFQAYPTTAGVTATNLPTNGSTVYVRVWVYLNGFWSAYQDFTYTAAPH